MTEDDRSGPDVSRRNYLTAASAAGAIAIAGCLGGDGDGGGDADGDGDGGDGDGGGNNQMADRDCDGVEPSLETAKSGEYSPLSRPLFTYPSVSSLARPEVAEYVRFFVEMTATDLISQVGYVPKTESDMQSELDALNETIAEAGGPAPGEAGDLSGEVAIAGSSTVFPVAEAVAEEFQKDHPDVEVSVQSTGSGGGFQNFFCPGQTDLNNASRPMKDEEKELCEENGVEWHEINVATDALTVVVNNDNDFAECLTVGELEQIWGPDAAEQWSDVHDAWPDEEIERHGAAETSGTFDYFTETIMGEEGAHTSDYSPTEQDNLIVQGVQGSEYAIGYFGFAYYSGNPDQVTAVAIDDGS